MTDWELVVRQHGPPAVRAAYRVLGNERDAEDAFQDALLDAWCLDGRQEVKNWGGFLRRLAVCRALDLLRRRRPWAALNDREVSKGQGPDAAAVTRERILILRASLARLTTREAEVFSLRHFSELTNSEIAEALKIESGAVAVALHKAHSRLQQMIDKKE